MQNAGIIRISGIIQGRALLEVLNMVYQNLSLNDYNKPNICTLHKEPIKKLIIKNHQSSGKLISKNSKRKITPEIDETEHPENNPKEAKIPRLEPKMSPKNTSQDKFENTLSKCE